MLPWRRFLMLWSHGPIHWPFSCLLLAAAWPKAIPGYWRANCTSSHVTVEWLCKCRMRLAQNPRCLYVAALPQTLRWVWGSRLELVISHEMFIMCSCSLLFHTAMSNFRLFFLPLSTFCRSSEDEPESTVTDCWTELSPCFTFYHIWSENDIRSRTNSRCLIIFFKHINVRQSVDYC